MAVVLRPPQILTLNKIVFPQKHVSDFDFILEINSDFPLDRLNSRRVRLGI
jgi:hypothetical protein